MKRKAISRYDLPGGAEIQTAPGSGGRVLLNRLALTRKREIDRAKYDALIIAQEKWLEVTTTETRFTAAMLCAMHRDWLGDIYDWAGQYRRVDLTKDGFTWPPAARVAQNIAVLEAGLLRKSTPCLPNSLPLVARQIAEVHAELLLIHPFREGNGRLARWLADLMALQARVPIPDYRFDARGWRAERARYLAAVKEGYKMRYDALTDFFLTAMTRRGVGG